MALDRSSHLAKCVAEAVRLRAPGIDMRMAAADVMLPCSPGRPVKIRKASLEPDARHHTPAAVLLLI